MITAGAIFSAIVAAIQAIPIVDQWFQQLMIYWMNAQTQATKSAIADAAAAAARATTDDERYKADAQWQLALQRQRILP